MSYRFIGTIVKVCKSTCYDFPCYQPTRDGGSQGGNTGTGWMMDTPGGGRQGVSPEWVSLDTQRTAITLCGMDEFIWISAQIWGDKQEK